MFTKTLAIKSFMIASTTLALFLKTTYQFFSKRKSAERKTICVIRLDKTVGDTVMNSSFLKALRDLNPEARIILVVHKNSFALVESSCVVDEVKTYNPGNSLKYSLLNRLYKTCLFVWREFDCIPDISIVPRFDEDHNAAFISLFSLAPVRVAWSEKVTLRKSVLNYSFDKLSTKIINSDKVEHEVMRGVEVLNAIHEDSITPVPELDIWLSQHEIEDAKKKFNINESNKKYICLGISSGHSRLKQWPLEYFKDLAVRLYADDNNSIFVLLGAKGDFVQGQEFVKLCNFEVPILNLISQTTLRETGAVLNTCKLYIGNDSGNLHLAAAAHIPTIGLYGSSCAHRFSPWGLLSEFVAVEKECGPCHQGHIIDRCSVCIYDKPVCMYELSVDMAYSKIMGLSNHLVISQSKCNF